MEKVYNARKSESSDEHKKVLEAVETYEAENGVYHIHRLIDYVFPRPSLMVKSTSTPIHSIIDLITELKLPINNYMSFDQDVIVVDEIKDYRQEIIKNIFENIEAHGIAKATKLADNYIKFMEDHSGNVYMPITGGHSGCRKFIGEAGHPIYNSGSEVILLDDKKTANLKINFDAANHMINIEKPDNTKMNINYSDTSLIDLSCDSEDNSICIVVK